MSAHKNSDTIEERLSADPELARYFREAVAESIGESLKEARLWANLTQEEVARQMGVSRSRVAQIESVEGTALSLGVLLRYSRAVGCRLDIDLVDPRDSQVVSQIFVVDDEPITNREDSAAFELDSLLRNIISHEFEQANFHNAVVRRRSAEPRRDWFEDLNGTDTDRVQLAA